MPHFPVRSRAGATRRMIAFAAVLVPALAFAPLPAIHAATITVDTLADSDTADGECSLREAIVAANDDTAHQGCAAGNGDDRVEFSVTGAIVLGSDLPVITKTLTLAGPPVLPPAAPEVILNGSGHRMLVLNGSPNGRTLTLSHLNVRNGFNPDPGGCVTVRSSDHLEIHDSRIQGCESGDVGGGIYGDDAASMRIFRSIVRNNVANSGGAALYLLGEGYVPPPPFSATAGAEPTAFFEMEDSTVSGNEAPGETAGGGVVLGYANGSIRRSTVSGNESGDACAGLMQIYGVVTVDGLTSTSNTADTNADDTGELGGGLCVVGDAFYPATMVLRNSVVGNNFAGAIPSDVYAGTSSALLSDGYNLIGVRDGAAAFFAVGAPNGNDDWVGSRAAPVLAGLGLLAANGGPTDTHAPSPGSLLVDHGDCPDDLRDQRGFGNAANNRRPVDNALVPDSSDGCDIGAYEADATELGFPIFSDGFESNGTGAWSEVTP